jgi:hypothetical protein
MVWTEAQLHKTGLEGTVLSWPLAVQSLGVNFYTPDSQLNQVQRLCCCLAVQVMSVNVRGVFLCLKHQIPVMLQNTDGPGAIVITSSTAGEKSQLKFECQMAC